MRARQHRRRVLAALAVAASLPAMALLMATAARAELLGRFEVMDARSRGSEGASPAAVVWSLDTVSGALSACNAAAVACASANPWKAGEVGEQRYRIASQYLDGAETAYVWIIDTATGAIRRCRAGLAAAPELACGE
jgi:hypothetical protein